MPISYKKLNARYKEKCEEVTRVNKRVAGWRLLYSNLHANHRVALDDIEELKKRIEELESKIEEDTT